MNNINMNNINMNNININNINMNNSQNLQYHLTNTDIFDGKNIDIDKICIEKSIYNIYNNLINEPFHNFWFLVDNCKFLKHYNNKNNSHSLVFVLNNKYEKHKKILLYIKNLLNYIKTICLEKYKDIDYILPWIENENFPISICIQHDLDSLFINYENNDMDINTLSFNNNNNYTILFEIRYFTIKNNKIKLILFSKLIQLEKQFDLKKSLIALLSPIKKSTIVETCDLIEKFNPINKIKKEDSITLNKSSIQISPNMLLEKLNQLKNKSLIKKNEEDNKILKVDDLYLEEKNQLKKTIINQNKDSYIIMKNNYLEEKGIVIEELENNSEKKIKKKKIIKIKKKKDIL